MSEQKHLQHINLRRRILAKLYTDFREYPYAQTELREIEQVVQREPKPSQIARDTERLVKPYALGKDCRQSNLQCLTNQGLEYFRIWASSLGKW